MRASILVSFLMLIVLSVHVRVASAQEALAFGFALDRLTNKLGGLINSARDAGLVLEVGAGGQLLATIEAAKPLTRTLLRRRWISLMWQRPS